MINNPTRRNRNLGTKKSGFKPQSVFRSAPYQERDFIHCEKTQVVIHGVPVCFYTEPTVKGHIHACSIEDVVKVLSRLPQDDVAGIEHIYFKQSTRKQNIFSPAWGRLMYYAGPHYMPLIELTSTPCPFVYEMPKSLNPFWQKELEFLKERCFTYRCDKRKHYLTFNQPEIRAIQLYRTLPHEIGHWIDYKLNLEHLPARQKEERANAYADKWVDQLSLAD